MQQVANQSLVICVLRFYFWQKRLTKGETVKTQSIPLSLKFWQTGLAEAMSLFCSAQARVRWLGAVQLPRADQD